MWLDAFRKLNLINIIQMYFKNRTDKETQQYKANIKYTGIVWDSFYIIIENAWVEDISRKDWVQINKRMCKETFNVCVCI